MNYLKPVLLIFFICYVFPINAAQPLTTTQWREDLHFMIQQLDLRHANLYHTISKEQFLLNANALDRKLPELKPQQIPLEFAKLIAQVGDGHTGIFFPFDGQSYPLKFPLELWSAPDGLFIVAASSPFSKYTGMKIVQINSIPIEKVKEEIEPLLPLDSPFGFHGIFPQYLLLPEILSGVGIISDTSTATFTVEDSDHNKHLITLKPVPAENFNAPEIMKNQPGIPLWLKNLTDPYWFEFLPESKTMYVNYNDASREKEEEPLLAFTIRLFKAIEEVSAERLILDLRWNDGGSIERTQVLLKAISESKRINQKGKLFTIISPVTFSAATLFCVDLERNTNTLFVGEPTGGKPNGYGELRRFRLPNSNLEVRYSAWYYQRSKPNDTRPAIMPHLRASISSGDFVSYLDSSIDAILKYSDRIDATQVLEKEIKENGMVQALKSYLNLKSEKFNAYEFSVESLIALAEKFLTDKKITEAVRLFELTVQEYPYSANAHAGLGKVYEMQGRKPEALKSAVRAFTLDKSFTGSLERAIRLGYRNETP